MKTIYEVAEIAMREQIDAYLTLTKATNGLTVVCEEDLADPAVAGLFAHGIGVSVPQNCPNVPALLIAEFTRKPAVDFDIETAVCAGVYLDLRRHASQLYDRAAAESQGFKVFDENLLRANPFLLPIFQNALRMSKAQLKRQVGSASDQAVSKKASANLSALLQALNEADFQKTTILHRVEITLEGIVRDLVGRVLLEEVVARALDDENISFLRESEYPSISGVVYDIRSDFVLPNHTDPIAFIEVRKSSSRHASLYAKDKMFSAINWKGRHENLIGVVVVEGEWTQATLKAMANVFDYVVPLSKVAHLARILRRAQDGDRSVLRWIVKFSISASPDYAIPTA